MRNAQHHSAMRLPQGNEPIAETAWPAIPARLRIALMPALRYTGAGEEVRRTSAVRCGEDVLRVFAPRLGGLVG